ncbi:MAG TPA: hypothetical protein VK034_14545, partial [Enhygromyxa sp.]|nr:hypothetical protein [Enhygromyxa sp.]
MPSDRTGGSKPLPPPFSGIAKDDERRAAVAEEYQRKLASIDLEQLDEHDDPPPPEPPVASSTLPAYPAASSEPGRPNRPNLEPIPEQAHPAKNRRIPTQPPAALSLDLDVGEPPPAAAPPP